MAQKTILTISLKFPDEAVMGKTMNSDIPKQLLKKIQQAVGDEYVCDIKLPQQILPQLFEMPVSDLLQQGCRHGGLDTKIEQSIPERWKKYTVGRFLEIPMVEIMTQKSFGKKHYKNLIKYLFHSGIKDILDYPIVTSVGPLQYKRNHTAIISELRDELKIH